MEVARRASRKATLLALAVPSSIALAWSLLMRPEAPTLTTPLLGPWAGKAFGHVGCTLATVAPGPSAAAVALGILVGVAWAVLRGPVARIVVPALAAVWAIAWSGLALLSVANTCS